MCRRVPVWKNHACGSLCERRHQTEARSSRCFLFPHGDGWLLHIQNILRLRLVCSQAAGSGKAAAGACRTGSLASPPPTREKAGSTNSRRIRSPTLASSRERAPEPIPLAAPLAGKSRDLRSRRLLNLRCCWRHADAVLAAVCVLAPRAALLHPESTRSKCKWPTAEGLSQDDI